MEVLGMGLQATDYAGGVKLLQELAQRGKPGMVAACNTHLVALARHRVDFGAVLGKFDLLLPDGMPLVWSIRRKGVELKDRVYGPYFMMEALKLWRTMVLWPMLKTISKMVLALKAELMVGQQRPFLYQIPVL